MEQTQGIKFGKRMLVLALFGSLCCLSVFSMAQSRVSFLNDVEPILTRYGCNQGACHGSQFGKGGFKLSLAAYDPDFDHENLTRVARGRRISVASPNQSLLLQKATLTVPHKGGRLLEKESKDYQTLARWIAEGAARPNEAHPTAIRLRAVPERKVTSPGSSHSVRVIATFSDGKEKDVTSHARISTLDDSIADTTPFGKVSAKGRGATAIMLRYAGLATVSHVVVPYQKQNVTANSWKPLNFIDKFASKRWDELGLQPSGEATDAEYLRRVSLDLIGTLPTPQDYRTFLADQSKDRRLRLVNRLLERHEYASYWAQRWSDLLRSARSGLGIKGMWSLNNWLQQNFAQNRGYDAFVYDLLTAQGSVQARGAVNYYRVAQNPTDLGETTAQVFLGIRMQCAKCHQHPFEKWSQSDYYRFAAYFARVGTKETKTSAIGSDTVVMVKQSGEVSHPKTKQVMLPAPLTLARAEKGNINPDLSGDRRLGLAEWMTSKENMMFARAVVNRYWSYLMGRGLVEPVDDVRVTNPPSNPELLDALARDFLQNGCDIKHLLRTITTSRLYRLSSKATPKNQADKVFYSHFLRKRIPAEPLLDALDYVTGVTEKFEGFPMGVRAIQLPDSSVASAFLDVFGRSTRATACECERVVEPDLPQALFLVNGEAVHRKIAHPEGRVARLLAENRSNDAIVAELYQIVLSRPPSSKERKIALQSLEGATDRKLVVEDLLWALLNTSEFAYIH